VKRLLNYSEEKTNSVLKPLTEEWGAHTFPKVRIADVLPIEKSGIDDESYSFALKAHFDFVVTNEDLRPLFAVEFNGDMHETEVQQHRDALKDGLCERFELPILRINARYIDRQFRQMDLLSWFVQYWFAQRAIDEAYEAGQIPPYEYVDPNFMLTLPGTKQRFPLWLAAQVRTEFHKFREQRRCLDPGPSCFVGSEKTTGITRAIAYMAVSEEDGLLSETAMRVQRFNVPCSELLESIAEHQIFDEFVRLENQSRAADSLEDICRRLAWYNANCEMLTSSKCSQVQRLREAI
jgi:hypothetical protein